MRCDMHDVLTGRPRFNRAWAKALRATRRRLRNAVERDGESAPARYSMRLEVRPSAYWRKKHFSDHLRPLERWMDKQVGRPWADVHSEISQAVSDDLAAWHLWLHVSLMVSSAHWVNPAQTGVARRDQSRSNPHLCTRTDNKYSYFVHPHTGLLCRNCDIDQLLDG